MIDGIIKYNGTSRMITGQFPDTYEEFKQLAAGNGVPADVMFNSSGWQQLPTFLSKANLLTDDTAKMFNESFGTSITINDIFNLIATFLSANPYSFTATLTTSGWSGSEETGYTQTATAYGIESTDRLVVIGPSFSEDAPTRKQELLSAYCINEAKVEDNKVIFTCFTKKPVHNLTVNIKAVRSL